MQADPHCGALFREAEHARLLPSHRGRQRQASQDRQRRIRLAIGQQHFHVDAKARPEVIAQTRCGRSIRHSHHSAKAWQVVAAGQFGKFWEVYDYLESLSEDPVVDHRCGFDRLDCRTDGTYQWEHDPSALRNVDQ